MKLSKKNVEVTITILTGFHIGVGNDKLQIGGVDSPIIKDPISDLPYIPGSSLKGKIRCLLETEGGFEDGTLNEQLNTFFGQTTDYTNKKKKELEQKKKQGETINENFESPTRILFRDIFLNQDYKEKYKSGKIGTEIKTEISIDRAKGSAKDGALRFIERVPPGTIFQGEILIRYTSQTELENIQKILTNGFELLNNDYLGGSGSRGYGAVQINHNL